MWWQGGKGPLLLLCHGLKHYSVGQEERGDRRREEERGERRRERKKEKWEGKEV